jgi:hypothetical protein
MALERFMQAVGEMSPDELKFLPFGGRQRRYFLETGSCVPNNIYTTAVNSLFEHSAQRRPRRLGDMQIKNYRQSLIPAHARSHRVDRIAMLNPNGPPLRQSIRSGRPPQKRETP